MEPNQTPQPPNQIPQQPTPVEPVAPQPVQSAPQDPPAQQPMAGPAQTPPLQNPGISDQGSDEKNKKRMKKIAIGGGALALISAIITSVTYYSAGPGDTYIVLWGPIALGVALMVSGIIGYLKFK